MAKSLEYNYVLQELELSKDIVNDFGAEPLASMLRINEGLRVLRLTENDIGDNGAPLICIAIAESNTTLKELYLDQNVITDIGEKAIGAMLPSMEGLLTFKLNGNKEITEAWGLQLLIGLKANTELLMDAS